MDLHIIDDDVSICALLAEMSDYLGFSAQTFYSPKTYLALTENLPPPLLSILTDIKMPEMNGFELMDEVRKKNADQKFVVISGSPYEKPHDEFACFYLLKPFTLHKFKATLLTLSSCAKQGPDPDLYDCDNIGERNAFCIEGWHCPLNNTGI